MCEDVLKGVCEREKVSMGECQRVYVRGCVRGCVTCQSNEKPRPSYLEGVVVLVVELYREGLTGSDREGGGRKNLAHSLAHTTPPGTLSQHHTSSYTYI